MSHLRISIMYQRTSHRRFAEYKVDRLTIISAVFFVLISLIVIKLFKMQIIDYGEYSKLAQDQHFAASELTPERGGIFIHDYQQGNDELYPVALNRKYYLVYAVPGEIQNSKVDSRQYPPKSPQSSNISINSSPDFSFSSDTTFS